MVDPDGLYHPLALLGFSDPARGRYTPSAGLSLQRNAVALRRGDLGFRRSYPCVDGTRPRVIWSLRPDGERGKENIVKLVTFQRTGKPDLLPGLFTDRGVVSIADAVPAAPRHNRR